MIPPEKLAALEVQVRSLMSSGRWLEGIQALRTAAVLYQESSDELARKVAQWSLAMGHVQPLVTEAPI